MAQIQEQRWRRGRLRHSAAGNFHLQVISQIVWAVSESAQAPDEVVAKDPGEMPGAADPWLEMRKREVVALSLQIARCWSMAHLGEA